MSASADVVAHGVHYAVLAVGLAGVAVLLGPRFTPERSRHRDPHDARVAELRRRLDVGRSPEIAVPALGTTRLLLPVAVVSSAAAAGVHAAVGPAHVREGLLLGLFFAGSALFQISWSVVVAGRGSTRPLLLAGVVGNLAFLTLWAVTRTVGLPFGLLPGPEAVGPWDLACGAWEASVVLSCAAVLRRGHGRHRLPPWSRWTGTARTGALGSAAALALLAVSGAGS
ncbi:hypothetical protein [Marmoricola sp. RAF53]|uniref:hypothetical protein n=1 Tax=Marmoricola sp. RAF53 TaxID=3233059 RepID=UPI003F9B711B